MKFRKGWYLVRTDHQGRNFCRYFNTASSYTAECYVEPDGAQILLWQAATDAAAKPGQWSSEYKPLDEAPAGDWWDNPKTSAHVNPDLPGDYSRKARKPTARELCQRAAHADPASADGLSCSKEIHVGLFFDGTNNNMERDKPVNGHSNIVSLYDAHRDDRLEYFRYYIPGVGTKFRQVKEFGESTEGKAFASGGESRIHWGMLQMYNAVCAAATGADLMQESEMTALVTQYDGLKTVWRLGDSTAHYIFRKIDERLRRAIEGRRPRVLRVNVSVFGFSRGAAQARTFCNWFEQVTGSGIGGAALRMRFVGLFDTVASVGLADSSPVGNGFMDWADGTMGITRVERGVHYIAAHEIRRSFPVSTARDASGAAVANISEYIYPGAHSDIGGGYSANDQGKATGGRPQMLSQIPLLDMHHEALNAGVEMYRVSAMEPATRKDFDIGTDLDTRFSSYAAWTVKAEEKTEDVAAAATDHVRSRMHYHMQLYWRWRGSKTTAQFEAMSSYVNATPQDRRDLEEAEADWQHDVARARDAHYSHTREIGTRFGVRTVVDPPEPSEVQRAIVAAMDSVMTVPAQVDAFFDQHVHDSHAGFWLLGPQTQYDRHNYIAEIRKKQQMYTQLLAQSERADMGEIRRELSAEARRYELNSFERRVLQSDTASPDSVPLMSDADAADMRDNAGFFSGNIVRYVMGTGTRREANGHGQYRRVFDRS